MPGFSFVLFTLLLSDVLAHSWVEEILLVADNGSILEPPGRPRSFGMKTLV